MSLYAVTVATQPSTPNQTCSVTNGSGSLAGSNITNVAISCVTNKYSIGGEATGLSGTVVLQNNSRDNLSVSANGSFTFATSIDDLGSYAASILTQPENQICSISNGSGTLAGTAVTNIALTCEDTYAVGVTVSGLAEGNSVVLQNNENEAGNLTVESNISVSFTARLLNEAAYSVTVLTNPTTPNQECAVTDGAGNISAADVTGIAVTCTTTKYSVGGTITGLTADKTIELQNTSGDTLVLTTAVESYPAFTFSIELDDEGAYSATILTEPDGQQCAVTNGSGNLAGADITDISVECYVPNALIIENHSRAVIASWNDTAADSYNLYYSKTDGFDPANCNVDPDCTAIENVTAPFTVTELVNDDSYYFVLEDVHGAIELESSQVTGLPKEWEFNGEILAMAIDSNGVVYLGGDFTGCSSSDLI